MLLVCACSKLLLTVDSTDDNYMPKRVTVYGGEAENLKKYSDVTIDEYVLSVYLFITFFKQCKQLNFWLNVR